MSKAEELYNDIATEFSKEYKSVEPSQMFGKPCIKINGKAFASFFQDDMVFKLTGDDHQMALSLKGAKLFDPSGKGRAMKEWVQIPFSSSKEWRGLAVKAMEMVASLNK